MVRLYKKFNVDVFTSELIVAVGSYNDINNKENVKTELLDVDGNKWLNADDYPFDWGLTYFIISLSFQVYSRYKSASISLMPRSSTSATPFTCLVDCMLKTKARRQSVAST